MDEAGVLQSTQAGGPPDQLGIDSPGDQTGMFPECSVSTSKDVRTCGEKREAPKEGRRMSRAKRPETTMPLGGMVQDGGRGIIDDQDTRLRRWDLLSRRREVQDSCTGAGEARGKMRKRDGEQLESEKDPM